MTTLTHGAPVKRRLVLNEATIAMFGAAVLLLGAVLWADRSPLTEKTDFSVTYIGARMVHEKQGARLYDLAEQRKMKASLLPNAEPLVYEHPPFEALLLSPLGGLPYRFAYLIWGLFNASIWLALPWLVRPYAPVPHDGLGYVALWFLFAPLGIALYQGQSSLLLLLLFTATFIELKHKQDLRAGLWLGLGLFKFQFVLPFVLILLLRRKWRFVAGFSLMATLLAILSVVAVGGQGIVSYLRLLANIISHPANISLGSATDMATVHGFIHALLKNLVNGTTVLLIVGTISTALILFTVWHWNRSEQTSAQFDLMFAAAIASSLVLGSHMFAHDLSPLLLAMFLAAAHLPRHRWVGVGAILFATLVVFWMPPLYFVLIAWHRMYLLFLALVIFAIAAMTLAAKPGITLADAGSLRQNVAD
jgi:hypothetical protein